VGVDYTPAPAVERVAGTLIRKNHPDLADERIEYVFRSEAAKENGKVVWGKARKVSGLNAFLARGEADELDVEDFFVIEIAAPVWSVLDAKQREALVDHELTHCTHKTNDKGDVTLALLAHDVEEFKSIIERHGLWRPDLEEFVKAGNLQLSLGDES
jgi:hypothetical protein